MKIQIEVQDWVVSQLEDLKDITGSDDYKELFNHAVALLAWAVEQRAAGNAVASIDSEAKEFRRLQMPALEYAAFIAGRGAIDLKAA